MYFVFSATFPK